MSHKNEEWWKLFSVANLYDRFNNIVEQFMGRSLTKDYDVLPALAGIARVFQSVLKDEYCAGLWKKDLLCSLIKWERIPRYPADKSIRFDPTRSSEYLAPSWSWGSMLGKSGAMSRAWETRHALKPSADRTAKILRVCTIPKDADPFGQVVGGELVLRVPYCLLDHSPPVYSTDHELFPDNSILRSKPQSKSLF